ncbi:hypothetical protein CRG98_036301 [Punica granatum]|uniref:EGF-like domain-containing protein n=1 Tax=Punica granatum TaxID=22663 RepID=A0A2I0IH31_PUNGR|nr:hypothetical protein CRG98_036301 [Punica granatum]
MAISSESLNFSNKLIHSLILLVALFVIASSTHTTASSHDSIVMSDSADDTPPDPCARVNCLQGTCKPSLLGFDCECYQGWLKPFGLPFCIVPNCTMNFGCGNASLPPSPPPAASVSPPLPFTRKFQ